jgi:hypothetical protein
MARLKPGKGYKACQVTSNEIKHIISEGKPKKSISKTIVKFIAQRKK